MNDYKDGIEFIKIKNKFKKVEELKSVILCMHRYGFTVSEILKDLNISKKMIEKVIQGVY